MTEQEEHTRFMKMAIEQSLEAARRGNKPVGSVIVRNGEMVGIGQNTVSTDFDPSAHAEVCAIRDACSKLKTVDLTDSTLYSAMEPCPMCCWAIIDAKISCLVLGGRHVHMGRTDLGQYSVESFLAFTGRHLEIVSGVLATECEEMRRDWNRR